MVRFFKAALLAYISFGACVLFIGEGALSAYIPIGIFTWVMFGDAIIAFINAIIPKSVRAKWGEERVKNINQTEKSVTLIIQDAEARVQETRNPNKKARYIKSACDYIDLRSRDLAAYIKTIQEPVKKLHKQGSRIHKKQSKRISKFRDVHNSDIYNTGKQRQIILDTGQKPFLPDGLTPKGIQKRMQTANGAALGAVRAVNLGYNPIAIIFGILAIILGMRQQAKMETETQKILFDLNAGGRDLIQAHKTASALERWYATYQNRLREQIVKVDQLSEDTEMLNFSVTLTGENFTNAMMLHHELRVLDAMLKANQK